MRCAVLLLLATLACSRPRVQGIATIEEDDVPLLSGIRAGDEAASPQFASGFYGAESDGWRWTRGHFTAVLPAPPDAATQGAVLELNFNVPDVVLSRLGPVTLSASISGIPLEKEIRSQSGVRAYRRLVPPAAFTKPEVLVEFSLDKVVQPNTMPGDDRELGVAVHSVALLPKAPPKASAP